MDVRILLWADRFPAPRRRSRQKRARAIETSMVLYMAPRSANMPEAARDVHSGSDRLTRRRAADGVCSRTGTPRDATPASADKSGRIVAAIGRRIASEVDAVRASPLPARTGQ
jgi:creatinine amidohydrolase/Fe(II)-dependent formamide hydrolase-like protein